MNYGGSSGVLGGKRLYWAFEAKLGLGVGLGAALLAYFGVVYRAMLVLMLRIVCAMH